MGRKSKARRGNDADASRTAGGEKKEVLLKSVGKNQGYGYYAGAGACAAVIALFVAFWSGDAGQRHVVTDSDVSDLSLGARSEFGGLTLPASELEAPWEDSVKCISGSYPETVTGCSPFDTCKRKVVDNFVGAEDLSTLLSMVRRGMAASPATGGPTIMDINSGFLYDNQGLVNIYESHRGHEPIAFSAEEFEVYGALFDKVREHVISVHGLSDLWFTAPTFVTRLVGNSSWKPKTAHDMYWAPHVDKDNTGHYDYSGLVYLSTHGEDFTGGEFKFYEDDDFTDPKGRAITVLPRSRRLITFSSGKENFHQVKPVVSGERFTFSMWFSCNKTMEFKTFLDGKRHDKYNDPTAA